MLTFVAAILLQDWLSVDAVPVFPVPSPETRSVVYRRCDHSSRCEYDVFVRRDLETLSVLNFRFDGRRGADTYTELRRKSSSHGLIWENASSTIDHWEFPAVEIVGTCEDAQASGERTCIEKPNGSQEMWIEIRECSEGLLLSFVRLDHYQRPIAYYRSDDSTALSVECDVRALDSNMLFHFQSGDSQVFD